MTSSIPLASIPIAPESPLEPTDPAIRAARDADHPRIAELAEKADMGDLSTNGTIYVAELSEHVAGFIKLVQDGDRWYVNPVVVDSAYRRQGAGSALMAFARSQHGVLRFVARGYAVPFYEALGCKTIPWEDISPLITSDCDDCGMANTCHPQPMMMP